MQCYVLVIHFLIENTEFESVDSRAESPQIPAPRLTGCDTLATLLKSVPQFLHTISVEKLRSDSALVSVITLYLSVLVRIQKGAQYVVITNFINSSPLAAVWICSFNMKTLLVELTRSHLYRALQSTQHCLILAQSMVWERCLHLQLNQEKLREVTGCAESELATWAGTWAHWVLASSMGLSESTDLLEVRRRY